MISKYLEPLIKTLKMPFHTISRVEDFTPDVIGNGIAWMSDTVSMSTLANGKALFELLSKCDARTCPVFIVDYEELEDQFELWRKLGSKLGCHGETFIIANGKVSEPLYMYDEKHRQRVWEFIKRTSQ